MEQDLDSEFHQQLLDGLARITDKPLPELKAQTPLDALGLDSVDWMELVFELEEQLGVQIERSEIQSLTTLGSLQQVVKAQLEHRGLSAGEANSNTQPT